MISGKTLRYRSASLDDIMARHHTNSGIFFPKKLILFYYTSPSSAHIILKTNIAQLSRHYIGIQDGDDSGRNSHHLGFESQEELENYVNTITNDTWSFPVKSYLLCLLFRQFFNSALYRRTSSGLSGLLNTRHCNRSRGTALFNKY